MSKTKNKTDETSLLGTVMATQETKGDIKNSLVETVKDVVLGVVAGGVAGSAIGRASLLIGAAVTATGYYYKNRIAQSLGFGMMAANGFQNSAAVSGTEKEGLEGAKERILSFKESFSQKLYLDKLKKKKTEATNGMGEVQYFVYPNQEQKAIEGKEDLDGKVDMTDLERIEKQVAESASNFQTAGITPDVNEFGEVNEEGKQY